MGKSHKTSVMKRLKDSASRALPLVNKGLTTVGNTAKNITEASIPIVEKGVSAVYGTMSTGLDLGVKGVKTVTRGVTKRRSRSRSLAGGRRYRNRRTRHRRRH